MLPAMGQDTANSKKPTDKTHTASVASKPSTGASKKSKSSGTSSARSKSSRSAVSSKNRSKYASSRHGRRKSVARGQQKIDPARAQEIQEALIREHYLSSQAAGMWNQASEDAMRRYQADHGWQSKTVPDSRALISLGLGPSKDHLLNPDSAMTTVPDAPKSQPMPTSSYSAPATAAPVTPAARASTPASTPTPVSSSSPQ